jgi:methyl-accepting chemotaxis protein
MRLSDVRLLPKILAVVVLLAGVAATISFISIDDLGELMEGAQQIDKNGDRIFMTGRATANLLNFARHLEHIPLELPHNQISDHEASAEEALKLLRQRLDELYAAAFTDVGRRNITIDA